MSALGSNGIGRGFGNKLFQYIFLKTYARRHNLQVETPEWIGRYLFGCNDPAISCQLPSVAQVSPSLEDDPVAKADQPYQNVDFIGYFQYHTRYYAPDRDYIRSLFRPVPEVQAVMDAGVRRLRSQGETMIGIHLRRGDYEKRPEDHFFVTPSRWYLTWLNNIWDSLRNPVLFIASDEPDKVLNDFSDFRPTTSEMLGVTLPKARFFPDFFILTQCDVVAISNSTFSFAACMLNERAGVFMRPYPPVSVLVPFDPWNDNVLYRTDYHTKRYVTRRHP